MPISTESSAPQVKIEDIYDLHLAHLSVTSALQSIARLNDGQTSTYHLSQLMVDLANVRDRIENAVYFVHDSQLAQGKKAES